MVLVDISLVHWVYINQRLNYCIGGHGTTFYHHPTIIYHYHLYPGIPICLIVDHKTSIFQYFMGKFH